MTYRLEDIITLYPQLYSQKRLDAWQGLFDDRAMIIRVVKGSPVSILNIREAMPEQWAYVRENKIINEVWDRIEIRKFGNIAVIKAAYSLTADHEVRKGTDVLTLVCQDDGWRIVNLVYEQIKYIPE